MTLAKTYNFQHISLFIMLTCIFLSPSLSAQKTLDAKRIDSEIVIDGIIDEAAWADATIASDFITLSPVPGQPAGQDTKVKVLYDDEAIYISADMEEVARDSILTELTQRDNVGNTDAFMLLLDTYRNGTDGILLLVGATGVQYDARKQNNGNEDSDWDAVWFSEVNLTDTGWTCEMKIPYAAIRFPNEPSQEWTANFIRIQRRKNSQSSWSEIDPEVNGIFTQSGTLTNIHNIKPPVRISLTPYLSTYATHYHDVNADPVNSTGYSYNAGMDVKYGINDAFTLDMTLIPDFGQVESDDLVVNLSPFEVQLSEKRPFFTEGLELFSKGDIFYTRRVGGTAFNYYDVETVEGESLLSNPQIPQLYNATKVSGRTAKGTGIGVFNAVEAKTEATIANNEDNSERKVVTHPLTNYSVIVVDQNLKNNSYVSLINSNVWRKGADFYDANVIATDWNLKDKNQRYSFNGQAAISTLSQLADENINGHRLELEVEKISGNINWWMQYNEISPDYDHNDLGFLRNPNFREMSIGGQYSIFDPVWIINRANFWVDAEVSRIVEPNVYTDTWYNWGFWTQLKNFWNVNMWFNHGTERKDYFEPRTADYSRYLIRPTFNSAGGWIGTDNRKKFRFSINGNLYNIKEDGRWGYNYGIGPRYRFSDKLTLWLNWFYNIEYDDTGWVGDGDDGEIYIGQRDYRNIQTLMNVSYTFNQNMGITLRTRHDWTTATYQSFHELNEEGGIPLSDYTADLDFSNTFFSVDCVFNWRFAPGSDLNLVWKNNINGYNDNPALDYSAQTYRDGIRELGHLPQQNSLSLRLTYYLDQTNFAKWF